jgi:hypothetical protein
MIMYVRNETANLFQAFILRTGTTTIFNPVLNTANSRSKKIRVSTTR